MSSVNFSIILSSVFVNGNLYCGDHCAWIKWHFLRHTCCQWNKTNLCHRKVQSQTLVSNICKKLYQ